MNNPFSRLKLFLWDKSDLKENHATECLAACLVFSPRIAREFVSFLFADDKSRFNASADVEITTQESIGGGYIDLVLRSENDFVAAIEVKIGSPEDCPHHRDQLERYKSWLDAESKTSNTNGYLFTLVQNPDAGFCFEDYRVEARRTWRDLYGRFQKMLQDDGLCDVERNLIKHLNDYLERQGIVMTYQTNDLRDYSKGIKAREALENTFEQVAPLLKEMNGEELKVSIGYQKDSWPRLVIRHSRWRENWKVCLWFSVPPIWGATQHEFWPEIELWHQDNGIDWQEVKSRLPKRLSTPESPNLKWAVFQTWSKSRECVPVDEIQSAPKKITAWRAEDRSIVLDEAQPLNPEDLVSLLVERVKQLARIVDSLDEPAALPPVPA